MNKGINEWMNETIKWMGTKVVKFLTSDFSIHHPISWPDKNPINILPDLSTLGYNILSLIDVLWMWRSSTASSLLLVTGIAYMALFRHRETDQAKGRPWTFASCEVSPPLSSWAGALGSFQPLQRRKQTWPALDPPLSSKGTSKWPRVGRGSTSSFQ